MNCSAAAQLVPSPESRPANTWQMYVPVQVEYEIQVFQVLEMLRDY